MSAPQARAAQRAVPRSGGLGRAGDLPARARAGARRGVPGPAADGRDDLVGRGGAASRRLGALRERCSRFLARTVSASGASGPSRCCCRARVRSDGAARSCTASPASRPCMPGARAVVTLHDVTFLVRPTFGRLTHVGDGRARESGGAARGRADHGHGAPRGKRSARCSASIADASRSSTTATSPHARCTATPAGADSRALRARRRACGPVRRREAPAQEPGAADPGRARALDPDTVIVLAGHAEPYEHELRALARELGRGRRAFASSATYPTRTSRACGRWRRAPPSRRSERASGCR